MLFVIHGSDTTKVADKTAKLVAGLLKKREGAQVYYFDDGDLMGAELDALIGAQGLFVERHIVVLKQPFAKKETKEIVLDRLQRFKESENVVILAEGKLLATEKKKIEKHAQKVERYDEVKKEEQKFNVFALGDALGKKSKRELWTLYMQALRSGVEVESVHGTLHWTARALLTASNSNSPEEAGQKPFVYQKYRRYGANFKEGELLECSRELIALYHDSRRGRGELKTSLEHWILSL